MSRRIRIATALPGALAVMLALLVGACGGDDDSGERGDPNARVVLWPIPSAGLPVEPPLRPDPRDPLAPTLDAGLSQPPPILGAPDAGPALTADPTLDQLDPEQVYLFGTLSEGACYLDAIAPVLAPDQALVGFDCGASAGIGGAFVRPSDGRMVYALRGVTEAVYGFHCDGCNFAASQVDYPADPLANDELIPTPACDTSPFSGLFVVTAEGDLAYRCQDGHWYGAGDQELLGIMGSPAVPLNVGYEGTALTADGVVDLETGELAPFEGLTQPQLLASRATDDGYLIAVQPEGLMQPPPELWKVDFDGAASSLGAYPSPPADQEALSQRRLDGEGRLVQFARDTTASFRDTIIRRSVDGESAVIYDEADDPVVKVHISSLFTGP